MSETMEDIIHKMIDEAVHNFDKKDFEQGNLNRIAASAIRTCLLFLGNRAYNTGSAQGWAISIEMDYWADIVKREFLDS